MRAAIFLLALLAAAPGAAGIAQGNAGLRRRSCDLCGELAAVAAAEVAAVSESCVEYTHIYV